jgi:hypothetical protein
MWVLRWSGITLVLGLVVGCEAPFQANSDETLAGGSGAANAIHGGSGGAGDDESGAGAGGEGGDDGGSSSAGKPTTGGVGGGAGTSPVQIADCDDLAAPGVFEDITPAEVKAGIGEPSVTGNPQGGPFAIAVDPGNSGTYYLGTEHQGVWKTTDCGSRWTSIATGKNSAKVNGGINWTFAIDAQDPQTVYTSSAYSGDGLFKSTDGGVSWTDIWSGSSQPELGQSFTYNLVHQVAIDPDDHRHLLLTMHESCLPPHPTSCILESKDAGSTWQLHDGLASWEPDLGQAIHFLGSSSTWLTGSQSNGVWRTPDAGKTWAPIEAMMSTAQQGIELVGTRDGSFYVGGSDGIWRSPDGAVDSWELVPDTGPFVNGLATDGTTVYASTCYAENYCDHPRYLVSTDGQIWKPMTGVPPLSHGGLLEYDTGHHLLVSSNRSAGVWRVVVP